LYNEKIDKFLDYRFFVPKNTLLKFIEKFNIKDIKKYDYLYNPLDIELLKNNILSIDEIKKIRNEL
jgi:hypothetical protein